jgi:hypothetical protein
MIDKKDKAIEVINSILESVKIHKNTLTTFIEGDGEKLQQIEAENEKINIIFNNQGEVWGINALALLDTIVSILADDNLIFTTDSEGFLTKVVWKSKLEG